MTLQRIVGAGVLSVIFVILAAILLHQDNDNTEQEYSIKDDNLALLDLQPAEEVQEKKIDESVLEDAIAEEEKSSVMEKTISEKAAVEFVVPKPTVVETPKIKWFLQVASFSQQENAKQLILDLKKNGIEAKADMVIGQKGQIYRVRTAAVTNRGQVEYSPTNSDEFELIKQHFDITAQLLRRTKN